jgi:hypothetical protein
MISLVTKLNFTENVLIKRVKDFSLVISAHLMEKQLPGPVSILYTLLPSPLRAKRLFTIDPKNGL